MTKTWRQAVWEAVQREADENGEFTSRGLKAHQLDRIKSEVGTTGLTPDATMRKELQALRDSGLIWFGEPGQYGLQDHANVIPDVERAAETEAAREVFVRLGQSSFRRALLERWDTRCPLTGITEPPLLKASHIVPWRDCWPSSERLDPDNGLLLSALWDSAFDAGLVTFDDDGTALAAPGLSAKATEALRMTGVSRVVGLTAGNRERLKRHRMAYFGKTKSVISD